MFCYHLYIGFVKYLLENVYCNGRIGGVVHLRNTCKWTGRPTQRHLRKQIRKSAKRWQNARKESQQIKVLKTDSLLQTPFYHPLYYPPISDCRSLLACSISFTINYRKQKAPLCFLRRCFTLIYFIKQLHIKSLFTRAIAWPYVQGTQDPIYCKEQRA